MIAFVDSQSFPNLRLGNLMETVEIYDIGLQALRIQMR